jgi:hypothetical protein
MKKQEMHTAFWWRNLIENGHLEDREEGGRITLRLVLRKKGAVIAQRYSAGLGDGSGVREPAGVGSFTLHHRDQTGSGAHPASYPMGTRGSFLGAKAAEA